MHILKRILPAVGLVDNDKKIELIDEKLNFKNAVARCVALFNLVSI
jgi:hypothetical protein